MSGRRLWLGKRIRWFAAAAMLIGAIPVWAELTGPTAEDRRITLAVTKIMRDGHLTRHELNDEIAERLVTNYLKGFDPFKRFFYQEDVDRFRSGQSELDDMIKRGNVDFAFQVYDVFLKRLDERYKWIEQLLTEPVDFTLEEDLIRDP